MEAAFSLYPLSVQKWNLKKWKVDILFFEFELVNKSKMLVIFMVFATNEIEIELQSVNGYATC